MSWYYKGKIFQEATEDYGFVYCITIKDYKKAKLTKDFQGRKYIGQKSFFSKRTVSKGKKELEEMKDKRGSKKKKIIKESDWKTYKSSNSLLKTLPEEALFKEILIFCKNKTDLTYQEVKLQFLNNVLESDEWLNGNILNKFFKRT